ncbi:hypothetical protein ACIF9R_12315 [Streptomyces sp. NPDC086080]|uniref:hypothetical protein n=1 Tax=Streptomyces sp. NPDC086080 TaxID=3365748 RepID=UPI0037D6CCF0
MANQPGEPRKVRWTVPAADTSVIEWLDQQENISQSLRLLIRESIQRDGYIDVFYKPVDQLPRRGRPPLESIEQREDDEAVTERRPAARPVQPQPAVADEAEVAPDTVVEKTAPAPVAQPEPVPAPVETAEEPAANAPSPASEPPKQASIDEIMASTRR